MSFLVKSAITSAICLASFSVLADEVTITTGVRGGVYDGVYGSNVAKYLKSKGHTVVTNTSAGSEENLNRLGRGEAQIGFATIDAYAMYLKRGGAPLNVLSNLNTECGYLVSSKSGKVSSEDSLQTIKGVKIAIGDAGSGSNTMWNYMTQLEPKYKNAAVILSGGTLALNSIGTPSGPDAMLFVTSKDNLTHKLIQAVNSNKSLQYLDIDDGDLNDKLPDGQSVYTFERNNVCSGWGCSITTICTQGAIFYTESTPKIVLEDLSDIIAMSKTTITGK
jgi:hypothetical protein